MNVIETTSCTYFDGKYTETVSNEWDKMTRLIPSYNEIIDAAILDLWSRNYKQGNESYIDRILDVGIGTGNLSKAVVEKFVVNELYAIDQSSDMFNIAKTKIKKEIKFIKDDLRNISKHYELKSINVIVTSFALHHLADQEKADWIKQCFSILKDGGILLIIDRMYRECNEIIEIAGAKFVKDRIPSDRDVDFILKTTQKRFDEDGDKPSTPEDHIKWFNLAGFKNVYSPFTSFCNVLISGSKI